MAQTNFTPILTYKSDTAAAVPSAGNLTNSANGAELAVNTADKRLFTKDSGGNVVELGTNPSSVTLPNGTANGVVYANGSKVLTTGSALTFDGTNFNVVRAAATDQYMSLYADGTGPTLKFFGGAAGKIAGITADSASASMYFINEGNKPFVYAINGSEQMRLTSTGLGIGTSSPSTKLDVRGSVTSQADNAFYRIRRASAADVGYVTDSGTWGDSGADFVIGASSSNLRFYTNNSGTERMRLDASGNLGLGVTPSAWGSGTRGLDIGSGSAIWNPGSGTQTQLLNNSFNNGTNFIYKNSGSAARYRMVGDQHEWFTAPSGTAGNAISFTQAATLTAAGDYLVGKTGVSDITVGFQTSSGGRVACGMASGDAYILYSTSASAYRFYVTNAGVVNATSTTITAISDQRLKENIRDLDDGLDVVMALKPRKFDWKEGKGENIKNARGFIAQEFEQVLPDMIHDWRDPAPEGEEPYKAVNANLIPTLVKAIQELKAEFDAYKAAHP